MKCRIYEDDRMTDDRDKPRVPRDEQEQSGRVATGNQRVEGFQKHHRKEMRHG